MANLSNTQYFKSENRAGSTGERSPGCGIHSDGREGL